MAYYLWTHRVARQIANNKGVKSKVIEHPKLTSIDMLTYTKA